MKLNRFEQVVFDLLTTVPSDNLDKKDIEVAAKYYAKILITIAFNEVAKRFEDFCYLQIADFAKNHGIPVNITFDAEK